MKPSTNIPTPSAWMKEASEEILEFLQEAGDSRNLPQTRQAMVGAIIAKHAPSPSPTDDGLEMAAKYVAHNPYPGSMFLLANEIRALSPVGWEGDLLDDACKELDRALASNSNSLPAPAIEDGVVEFAKWAIQYSCFDGTGLDGADVQEKAENLGLLVKTTYDPEIHGPNDVGADEGDEWFVFGPALLQSPTPPAALQVPDGWQLAPKEPTEEMLAAGAAGSVTLEFLQQVVDDDSLPYWFALAKYHYKKMLAAAPPQGSEM